MLVAWVLVSLFAQDAGPPAVPPPSPQVDLLHHPVGHADLSLEVVAGACGELGRSIEIRLLRRGKPLPGVTKLPWTVPCAIARKGKGWEGEHPSPAGQPARVAVRFQPLQVAPDASGLYVEQTNGIEHTGRFQAVVAAVRKKSVRVVWQEEEGVAPGRVDTTIVRGATGESLRHVRVVDWSVDHGEAPDPDFFDVELVSWDARAQTMRRRPGPAWAVLFGAADDVPAARAFAGELNGVCKALHPLVVETKDFSTLAKRAGAKVAVAAFATDVNEALRLQRTARGCKAIPARKQGGEIVVLRPTARP